MHRFVGLALVGLAGCASHAWSSPANLVVSGRSPSASTQTAAQADLCAQVRIEEGIAADAAGGARFLCAATPGGAWAVRIDPPGGTTSDLAIVVLHADARGGRLRSTTPMAGAATWWPTLAPLARGATVFDFDGDGEPEIFLHVTRIGFAEVHVQQVFMTMKEGQITDYAPAASLSIEAFEDVDGDGRPDARIEPHRYAHASIDGSFWVEKSRPRPNEPSSTLRVRKRTSGTSSL